ncbi:MAG: ATP synthase subunit I [Methylococcaceae bacterium]|jgi:F1F0 ATPase subunit 2
MNEWLMLFMVFLAGAVLGGLFFGGLWWTINKSLASPQPALWLLSSLLLRMGLTLAVFYWLSDGHWQRLISCLLGFIVARQLLSVRLPWLVNHKPPEKHHAP